MQLNRVFIHVSLWLLGSLFLGACDSNQSAAPTTIYLVRHAEKDLTDPSAKNPPLSPAGVTRAQHLAQKLQSVPFDAVYSTSFTRNRNTVKPLADQKGLRIQPYQWHDYEGINQILKKHKGKTLLLCGHGDNLLPIIKNTGATLSVDSIGKNEYDKLFIVVIGPDGVAQARIETFN